MTTDAQKFIDDMHAAFCAAPAYRWWSPWGWKRDGWRLRRITFGDIEREMFPEGFQGFAVRYDTEPRP